MRIAISSRWIGGIGGTERCVVSMIRALHRHEVVVFAKEVISSEMLPKTDECKIVVVEKDLPWPWSVLRYAYQLKHKMVGAPHGHFDAYIHMRQGAVLRTLITSTVSGINPAGGEVFSLLREIPTVLSEAPSGEPFALGESHGLLLPPPLVPLSTAVEPVQDLPARFLLTVFNPYEPVKGADILSRVAPFAALPIVWCYSNRTVAIDQSLTAVPNVIAIHDPTQAMLNYLYRSASGYVSFSRREGFGWSIADALLNGLPVASRLTGCVHFVAGQRGISLYDDETALEVLLKKDPNDWWGGVPDAYDLADLSGDRFVERVETWVKSKSTH